MDPSTKPITPQDVSDLKTRHLAAVASCAAASQNLVDVRTEQGAAAEDISAAAAGYRTAESTMMQTLQTLVQSMQRYLTIARDAVPAPGPSDSMFFNAPDGSVQVWDPEAQAMRRATDEEVLSLAKLQLGGQPG